MVRETGAGSCLDYPAPFLRLLPCPGLGVRGTNPNKVQVVVATKRHQAAGLGSGAGCKWGSHASARSLFHYNDKSLARAFVIIHLGNCSSFPMENGDRANESLFTQHSQYDDSPASPQFPRVPHI